MTDDAQTAAPRPPRARRRLHAAALLYAVLIRSADPAELEALGAALADLIDAGDLCRLLIVAGEAWRVRDRAALADWLAEALQHVTSAPAPRFGPVAQDAEAWAAVASEAEIKAWALACVGRLSGADRLKFVAAIQGQALAAAS